MSGRLTIEDDLSERERPWAEALPDLPLESFARLAVQVTGMSGVWIRLFNEPGIGQAGSLELPPAKGPSEDLPVGGKDVLVVSDARHDPRLSSHPRVVGAPFIRFYASLPLRNVDGSLAGALTVADTVPRLLANDRIDALGSIARQVEACLELRARGERTWEASLVHLPLGLFVVRLDDPEDDDSLRIVSANPAARRLAGDTVDEIVGLRLADAFGWARPRGVLERCARVARSGVSEEMDLGAGAGEAPGPIHALRLFPLPGARVGVALEDVTERRELRRLKAEFVASVSHELRTPLAAVRGAVGLLDGGVGGSLPDTAARLVGIARAGTERLIRLVNDILDLERLRDSPVRGGRADIRALTEAARHAVSGPAREADVRVETALAVSGAIPGDTPRLAQALTNLASNAVKYSPPGASVSISATSAGPGWVRLAVRDEGEGLAPEQVSRIFLPFQPVDGSDARVRGGAGLGLAITRVITEGHRGRVGVDTAPGRGATFWMELPYDAHPFAGLHAGELAESADAAGGLSGGWVPGAVQPRALVVDADFGMRSLVAGRLASLGWTVVEAVDGAEAIVQARAHAPDLIVIDVGVPRPNGFEVVEILGDSSARGAALVVTSVRELTTSERARLRLGPTLVLAKGDEVLDALVDFVGRVFPGSGA